MVDGRRNTGSRPLLSRYTPSMTTLTAARRFALTTIIAATAMTGLAACSSNPLTDAVQGGIEGAIEEATGADVNVGSLPNDFPSEVPIVEGEIVFSAGTGAADGWVVTITAAASDPLATAKSELEAAGFAANAELGDAVSENGALYVGDQYTVLLVSDGDTVTYTVAPAAE